MAITTARHLNLVAPSAHEAGVMCATDTAGDRRVWSGTVSPLIGDSLRQGDLFRAAPPSTRPTTPGSRTSAAATRTTPTRTTPAAPALSADSAPTLGDLVVAYLDCRRHKANTPAAIRFAVQLERNLVELHEELVSGAYRPGRSVCFVVTHPRPREVWAAGFRDRIVHHLLYNRIAPAFLARFSSDSCACIPGRGTLYGAKRLERHVRSITQNWSREAFALCCDLSNFFVAIDKRVLDRQLVAGIADDWSLRLARTVLWHDPRSDHELRGGAHTLGLVPQHKSLFNAPTHCGLPIGNLSSQFFANVYLNPLDQRVNHQLRCRYVRYVDDFVLLHESPRRLLEALDDIEAYLPNHLGARLNPTKTKLQPVRHGIDFVGQIVRPWRRVMRPRTVNVGLQRLAAKRPQELHVAGNSYLGLVGQATHGHADAARIANLLRRRGHCVASDLSKAYRSAHHEC